MSPGCGVARESSGPFLPRDLGRVSAPSLLGSLETRVEARVWSCVGSCRCPARSEGSGVWILLPDPSDNLNSEARVRAHLSGGAGQRWCEPPGVGLPAQNTLFGEEGC